MSNEERTNSSQPFINGGENGGEPPLILAVETATRAGSVSVARGEQLLASATGEPSSSHSTDLIGNVDAVLRAAGTDVRADEVFAAAIGPGSFTGLRIGLATVKSLAVALNRKCAAIPTLAAIAYAAGKSAGTVALLPAGRGELFAQLFSVTDTVQPLDEPAHISPTTVIARYAECGRLLWAGEGAQIQIEALKRGAVERSISFQDATAPAANGWTLAPAHARLADAVAQLALQRWRAGSLIDPEDLRANYVRPSDAEIKAHVSTGNSQ